jgi:glycosyltransferase involved in cell wall biosynthesis
VPYLTVLVSTYRVGGFDVLFESLANQAFKDFELIIVDSLAAKRNSLPELKDVAFPFKIVAPIDDPFPVASCCRDYNSGFVQASGEVVVFFSDYTWVPPGALGVHAQFHKDAPGRGLMCPHVGLPYPEIKSGFPKYDRIETVTSGDSNTGIDKYVTDLASGALDPFMWSLFSTPILRTNFTADANMAHDHNFIGEDRKLTLPPGPIEPSQFHVRNESVALEALLTINGFDEDLDGGHCWEDTDLADRLGRKAGVGWILDPSNPVYIVNPRPVFPLPRRVRPYQTNEGIWMSKRAANYPTPNKWSLRERAQQIRAGKVTP